MKVAGLFAGAGGLELGLQQAGFTTTLLCEIDVRAQAVLKGHFPHATLKSDVREISQLPRDIGLITAGFPCQNISQAGRTDGIFGSQSGLIRNLFKLLAKRPPPWVLIENVPFLLRLDGGRGMAYVVRNLERLGYRWAYRVIDTRAFGLPQRRQRIFLLASQDANPAYCLLGPDKALPNVQPRLPVAHGFYWTEGTRGLGWAVDSLPTIKGGSSVGIPSPPAIWFSDGRFATPDVRDAERLQGFPVNWTKPAEKAGKASHRWTLVGNAVSVPIARWIGRGIIAGEAGKCSFGEVKLRQNSSWPNAAFGGPGTGRFAVEATPFPVSKIMAHLDEFLRFDSRPLSVRAATGFRGRLQCSSLKRPAQFDEALDRYIDHQHGD